MKGKILLLLSISLCFFMSCENEKYPELIEARKKIKINQSERYYLEQGYKYIKTDGKSSFDALANFEVTIKSNPYNGHFYSLIANSYCALQDYTLAEENYNKALRYGFDASYVYYNRAICKYNRGDINGAIADNETAIEKGSYTDSYGLKGKLVAKIN